jgi:hypothetical protein
MTITRWSLLLAVPLASACLTDPELGAEGAPSVLGTSILADRPTVRSTRIYEPPPQEPLEPGTTRWIRRIGSAGVERAGGLALGASGEILFTGSFGGWIDFGPTGLGAWAGTDVFATALAGEGHSMWARQLSGLGDEHAEAIAGTPDGGYVIAGSFPKDIVLGDGSRQSRGGLDAFAARYDRYGAHVWSMTWGGAGDDVVEAIGVDGHGNVVVAGSFEGSASIAGARIDSAGGRDLYTVKIDAAGAVKVRRYGGDGDDILGGLSVAHDGSYAVAATLRWTSPDIDLADPVAGDVTVIAHDRAGNQRWSRTFGGDGADLAGGVVMDDNGAVGVALSFTGEVEFGDRVHRSAGGTDAMLAVFDPRGNEHWSTTLGGPGDDRATGVALDPMRGPVLTGTFQGQVSGENGAGQRWELPLEVHGGSDVFAVGYDFESRIRWLASAGSADHDQSAGVIIDHEGNAIIAGAFTGELHAPGAALTSSGDHDLFVLSIAQ